MEAKEQMEPPMHADARRLDAITEKVIGCVYSMMNELGAGFLEKVYENALMVEFARAGLKARQQVPLQVKFRGAIVGEYVADLIVEDCVIVELKVARALDEIHEAQCLNYLKATGMKVCLLINLYKPRVQIKRLVNEF